MLFIIKLTLSQNSEYMSTSLQIFPLWRILITNLRWDLLNNGYFEILRKNKSENVRLYFVLPFFGQGTNRFGTFVIGFHCFISTETFLTDRKLTSTLRFFNHSLAIGLICVFFDFHWGIFPIPITVQLINIFSEVGTKLKLLPHHFRGNCRTYLIFPVAGADNCNSSFPSALFCNFLLIISMSILL